MTISSNSRKKSRGAALLFKAAILVLIMTAVFTFTSCGEQQAAKKEPQALENKEQTLDAAQAKYDAAQAQQTTAEQALFSKEGTKVERDVHEPWV